MKKTYKTKNYLLLAIMLIIGVVSCNKKDASLGFTPGTGAPTITSVHTISHIAVNPNLTTTITTYDTSGKATSNTFPNTNKQVTAFDSTTATGKGGIYYAIEGTNLGSVTTVTFNGVAAYFNRALGNNNIIIVTIPSTAPFDPNQAAKLVVTTLHGSATFKFTILQPPPTITSIAPLAGNPGDTLTIVGTVLDNTSAVTFGTVAATIVSNTPTQLKVLIPAGVVQSYVTVTTPGGIVTSAQSFGFKYLIYADGLTPGWGGNGGGYSGYGGTVINFNNTTHVLRGTNSIAVTFAGAYSALQIGYGGSPAVTVSTLGLTAVKFSVYGGAGSVTGDQIQVAINGQYNIVVKIVAGQYTNFTIPLSTFGNPATIKEFVLQTFQGTGATIYVDDIGFI